MGETVGLPLALTDELRPIVRRLGLHGPPTGPWRGRYADHEVIALLCGVGAGRAGDAAERLVDEHQVTWLIAAGFAGGLDDAAVIGTKWLLGEVVPADDPVPILAWMPANADGVVGLSCHRILRDAEEKRQACAATGAVVVDCETAAVAEVALARGLSWSGVRVVSDDLAQPLPEFVLRHLDEEQGRVRLLPLFADLLLHPVWWPLLAKLARQNRTIAPRLADGVAELLEARR